MTLLKQAEIEIPLLEVLFGIGGQGKPKDIYSKVAEKFPGLTQSDLTEKMPSGANKWTNRIQWTRQNLINKGDIYSQERGIWTISKLGRKDFLLKCPSPRRSFR